MSAAMTGSKNPMYGRRPKHTDGMKGKHHSIETRKRMSESQKGRNVSEITRKKLSEALKGRTSWNKGIPMSAVAKAKLSDSKKGQLKDMHWWNNGIKCVRAKECPLGFVKGRLKEE